MNEWMQAATFDSNPHFGEHRVIKAKVGGLPSLPKQAKYRSMQVIAGGHVLATRLSLR
jgi:hypothetical protein